MEQHYLGDRLAADKPAPVDWIWGAFFLVARNKLDALSGKPLPDTFFLYYEDVQWCYELARQGWTNYYYPAAQVVHHLSGSGGGGSEEDKYWDKIMPNERQFLRIYKGNGYALIYYLLASIFHFSLRTSPDRERGRRYWKMAFSGRYS